MSSAKYSNNQQHLRQPWTRFIDNNWFEWISSYNRWRDQWEANTHLFSLVYFERMKQVLNIQFLFILFVSLPKITDLQNFIYDSTATFHTTQPHTRSCIWTTKKKEIPFHEIFGDDFCLDGCKLIWRHLFSF